MYSLVQNVLEAPGRAFQARWSHFRFDFLMPPKEPVDLQRVLQRRGLSDTDRVIRESWCRVELAPLRCWCIRVSAFCDSPKISTLVQRITRG
jgi:hypothetical protein